MNNKILMILTVVVMAPSVIQAQLSQVWEYVVPARIDYNHIRFINQDEIIFTSVVGDYPQRDIVFGKLNKNGTEDWYHEIDLGGNDAFFPPVVGSNNIIYAVGISTQYNPILSSFKQSLFTYSETGTLISTTILNNSSYANLGNRLTPPISKVNSNGDVFSITTSNWDVPCSVGSDFRWNSTFALNSYNYGSSNYSWEDAQPEVDFEYRIARVAGITTDGSVILLEHLADWKGNNCPIDVNIDQVRSTYINKYNSSGIRVWRKDLAPVMGSIYSASFIYSQNDDYAIIASYNSSGEYIVVSVSLATGDIEWTKNLGTDNIPKNLAIHNNYLFLATKLINVGSSFYLFDITTGTVLETMVCSDCAFHDYGNNLFDDEGNVYLLNTVFNNEGLGDYGITCYDINFNQLWRHSFGNTRIYGIIGIDIYKNIYAYGRDISGNANWKLVKYTQGATLTLKDANKDALSNKEVYLIRVADDAPLFTPDTLGIVKTDADGKIQLTPVQ